MSLVELLSKKYKEKRSEFPSGQHDFPKIYEDIAAFLDKEIHSKVNFGALLTSQEVLTDHGADHVRKVIARAGDLLGSKGDELTGFEIFLLLLSIHFHDIGNILGREEHENKIRDVMKRIVNNLYQVDSAEQRMIMNIAKAHGGKRVGDKDKDTIAELEIKQSLKNQKIRPRLIAAILRFADEISEDSERANRYLLQGGIPPKNEIYHRYANSLHTVMVEENQIELQYHLSRAEVLAAYVKEGSNVFLYDYILERVWKVYLELQYCRRFAPAVLRLDCIKFAIEIFVDDEKFTSAMDPISGTLEEKGFPSAPHSDLHELCPGLIFKDAKELAEKLKGGA